MYVESKLISVIRLRRYQISQRHPESKAIEKAVKQTSGILASSRISLEN